MSFLNAIPDKVASEAAAIQADLSQRVATARGNANLSPQGIQSAVAKVYLQAKAQMGQVQNEFQGTKATVADHLVTDLFGAGSVVGADAISARDADDRVGQLDGPDEAGKLLESADRNGDEVLARAVALRAYAELDGPLGGWSGWSAVLDAYTAKRPDVAAKLQALSQARQQTMTLGIAQGFVFSVDKPSELNGLTDTRIQAAADADLPAASAPPSVHSQLQSVYGISQY